jgi:hypothetical protein
MFDMPLNDNLIIHYFLGFAWGCAVGWYCCYSNMLQRLTGFPRASADRPEGKRPSFVAQQVHRAQQAAEAREARSSAALEAPRRRPPTD